MMSSECTDTNPLLLGLFQDFAQGGASVNTTIVVSEM